MLLLLHLDAVAGGGGGGGGAMQLFQRTMQDTAGPLGPQEKLRFFETSSSGSHHPSFWACGLTQTLTKQYRKEGYFAEGLKVRRCNDRQWYEPCEIGNEQRQQSYVVLHQAD